MTFQYLRTQTCLSIYERLIAKMNYLECVQQKEIKIGESKKTTSEVKNRNAIAEIFKHKRINKI